ncbi:hypothetical protein AB0C76_08625 [Kitasatospora sp. NPDC048722]|uniref:hypothetical protein n=1 Tax=Kitasatospora sp. NPDC048722 TaxID=3155639 RepID=UPI0033D1BA9B
MPRRPFFTKCHRAWQPIAKLYTVNGATSSTVLALIGVLLGTTGTLVGQHLTTRAEARRDRQHRTDAERAERKEAILSFLAAAQQVELVLDRRSLGMPASEDPEDRKLHDLWLAKKAVELVCSHTASRAAHEYTTALHEHLRNTVSPERPTKRDCRHAFVESARAELGGGPLGILR